jgi:hypothetical protein
MQGIPFDCDTLLKSFPAISRKYSRPEKIFIIQELWSIHISEIYTFMYTGILVSLLANNKISTVRN